MQMNEKLIPWARMELAQFEAMHFHEELELLFCLEGSIKVKTESDVWQMKKNDIIVVNSGVRHSIVTDQGESILCRILFSHMVIENVVDHPLFLIWCNSVSDWQMDFEELKMILKSIVKHCVNNPVPDLYYQGKVYELLHCLVKNYLITGDDVRYRQKITKNDERTQQILSYIQENYNKEITLSKLAENLYLTDAYLSRFFKKTFGVNFGEYVISVKLHYAVEDLLYSSKSITRIALDNGFSNMATFNKYFRNMYHMAPSDYKLRRTPQVKNTEGKFSKDEEKLQSGLKRYIKKEISSLPDADTQNISAEADVRGFRPYKLPWKMVLNVGEMSCLRDYRIRSELLRLNSGLMFVYVRFWNVLSDSMQLGRYISDDMGDYDFGYLDDGLDFLLQNHLKPLFQLGYKRAKSGYKAEEHKTWSDISNLFSFSSMNELLKVFNIMLKHLLVRYGQQELSSWRFEIWHPDSCYTLPGFFYKDGCEILSVEMYKQLRSTFPEACIGGAEFNPLWGSKALAEQLQIYKEQGVLFDFITMVSYPYKILEDGEASNREWQVNGNFMLNSVCTLKNILNSMGWGHLPIWLTEYSFTIDNRNVLNDSRFKGAYVLKNMSDVAELIDAAGYWILSDIYSEGWNSHHILYGGSGLATKDGIRKPVFFALYFLSILKPMIILSGSNYLLTTDGNGVFGLVMYNLRELNHRAFMKAEKEVDIHNVFEDDITIHCRLNLCRMAEGKYRLKRLKIDKKHGDILEWSMGNYTGIGLKHTEIWHLQQTCMPAMDICERWVKEDQILVVEEDIEANNFLYYEIEKVH